MVQLSEAPGRANEKPQKPQSQEPQSQEPQSQEPPESAQAYLERAGEAASQAEEKMQEVEDIVL